MSSEAKKRKLEPCVVDKSFMDQTLEINFMDSSIQHDRVLVVEGQKFYVHSGILSFSSEFFNTLFNGSFAEKSQHEIVLEEVAASEFQSFLGASYPIEFEVNGTNLECLMKLSARFLSLIVWKKCMKFLEPKEKFVQFDMADLLKWSEPSNSNEFKERVETYLIVEFAKMEPTKQLETAKTACDYNLHQLKKGIDIFINFLLKGGFLTETTFYNATMIREVMERAGSTTMRGYFVDYIAREFKHFGENGKINMFEVEQTSIRDQSKFHFESLMNLFVSQLPSEPSKYFTTLLEMSRKYNFKKIKNNIAARLDNNFKRNNSFQHVELAVKFDLEPLKTSMQNYLKLKHGSVTEDTKKILQHTSLEVASFALEALLKTDPQISTAVNSK